MGKLDPSRVRRAVAKLEHKRRARQRDAFAEFTTAPLLEHVYKNRSLRSALDMGLKSASIRLPQTNCLYMPPPPKRYRSIK